LSEVKSCSEQVITHIENGFQNKLKSRAVFLDLLSAHKLKKTKMLALFKRWSTPTGVDNTRRVIVIRKGERHETNYRQTQINEL